MAVYNCKKHGLTSVKMVCPHPAQQIELRIPMTTNAVEVDPILLPIVHLCEKCLIEWQDKHEELEREEFLQTLTPVCGKCFDERPNLPSIT